MENTGDKSNSRYRESRKYTVYNNDLKYRKHKMLNESKIEWFSADLEEMYHNENFDDIQYRIHESRKNLWSFLDLSHLDLNEIPSLVHMREYKHLQKIKYLFINNNKLQSLSGIEQFPYIVVIDVSDNELDTVSNLPQGIVEFVCRSNKITDVVSHEQLEILDCSDNPIVFLNEYPSLKSLTCHGCNLDSIITFHNITRLNATDNPNLKRIYSQPSLKHLSINNNTFIMNITHDNFPHLTELILSGTGSIEIDPKLKLKTLEIADSQITRLLFIPTLKHLVYSRGKGFKFSTKYSVLLSHKQHNNMYVEMA